jgi:PAS domain S-box-containing protein
VSPSAPSTVTNDGSVRWFLDETHEIAGQHGESAYRYGYLVEITERKELEEAVREAEERYRALVEELPLAIYIDRLDELSSNIYTSPQVERMLGYASEQWATDADMFVRILHPDDRDRVLAEHEHARASGEPLRTEYRLLSADGDVIWIRDEAVIVGNRDEGPRLLQGFLLDITERKTAEQALRDSEAELSRQKTYAEELLQLSPVAIVTLDPGEQVLSWNPAAEKLYGYTREEAVGTQASAQGRQARRRRDPDGAAGGPSRSESSRRSWVTGSAWERDWWGAYGRRLSQSWSTNTTSGRAVTPRSRAGACAPSQGFRCSPEGTSSERSAWLTTPPTSGPSARRR